MSVKVKSRTRAPNFTKEDQVLLFEAMKPYNSIIECKQTDSVKQADKQVCWTKITEIFNANSVGQPRTTENLIACYRNIKSKIKKQQSDAKMLLVDQEKRGSLIRAIEEDGDDWEKVASASNWKDPQLCEQGFIQLKKETQREENKKKKIVMGTGGGPHMPDENSEFSGIKKNIGSQLDGMYSMYDGDSKLMAQYQQTLPLVERRVPIEASFLECTDNLEAITELNILDNKGEPLRPCNDNQDTIVELEKTPQLKSRVDILRKKKEPALSHIGSTTCKKPQLNDSFIALSEAKLELVKLQKNAAEMDIAYKRKRQEIEMEEHKRKYF